MKTGESTIVVRLPRSHKEVIEQCAAEDNRSVNQWCWLKLMEAAKNQAAVKRKADEGL